MKEYICIIVSTPFQLISAFSIAEHNQDYDCDLYVIGNFKNYEQIAKKAEHTGLFSNVISYSLNTIRKGQQSKKNVYRVLMRQLSYLRFRTIGKNIAIPGHNYKAVYYAAAVSAAELIMYFQKEYTPTFYLFDDGVMTYRDLNWVTGEGEKLKFIKQFIYKKIGKPTPIIMVYSPELFEAMNPGQKNIQKLSIVTEKTKEMLCKVFEFGKEQSIKELITVIECKTSDYLSDTATEQLEEIYESVINDVGTNIVFKRHPRDTRPQIMNRKYLSGTVPFELFGCIENLSNKILVAWDSTAVLTPKLFYGQEPGVILLYRLVKGRINNYEKTDKLYKEFRRIYSDESKFIIPENYEEFKLLIESLMEKING